MSRTLAHARSTHRAVPASLWKVFLGFVVAVLFASCPAEAADAVTDGDMSTDPLNNWTFTAIAGTVLADGTRDVDSTAGQYGAAAPSLSYETEKRNGVLVEWSESQSIGTVNASDTVNVSFWYGTLFSTNVSGASGTVYFDIKPSAGAWTNVWSAGVTPNLNTFVPGSYSDNVSSSFTTDDTYEIRLRFRGVTGGNKNARVQVNWDDVVVDVTGPANAAPTITNTQADDGTSAATDITTCAGSNVTISANIDDTDGDPLDWTIYTDDGGGFTVCSSATGVTPPQSISCVINGISATTKYYVEVTDSIATTRDPSGAPGVWYDITVLTGPSPDPAFTSCNGVSKSQIDLVFTDTGTVDGGGVVVVRGMPAGSAPDWAPTQGVAPPIEGATDGTTGDYFVFVGSGTADSDTGLDANQAYSYEIWAYDSCYNYTTTEVQTTCSTQSAAGTVVGTTTAVESACTQITVTSEYSDDTGTGNSPGYATVYWDVVLGGEANTACEKLDGPSPRQCLVTGFPQGQNVYVRVVYTDTDGVSGANPWNSGAFNTTCGPDSAAPTIMFLAPSRESVIGGTDKVKVQVYDAGALAVVDPVQWKVDDGSFSATGVLRNANYDTLDDGACGTGCGVYEFELNTTITGLDLANGAHTITVQVADDDGNTAVLAQPVTVQNSGDKAAGDGFLLRRSHGSQLCVDCHNLKTHSSKNTSTAYGNWAIECVTCHTPHNTRNIHLIRETIKTPNSGTMSGVRFQTDTPGNPAPNFGFLGDRSQAENAPYTDGVCEVCHTKTNFHRNSAFPSDNAIRHGHEVDNSGKSCVGCHGHKVGFKGPLCNECHNAPPSVGKHGVHDEVWDSTAGNTAESYSDTASHATATQYGFACITCHDGGHINDGSAGTIGDPYDVEVSFDTTIYTQNDNGAYTATPTPIPDQGPDGNYWGWSDGSCANVYCHSIAQRTMTVDTADYKSVTWNQGGSLTCTSCHDDGGADSTLTSAHVKHTDATTYQFGCVRCHSSTVNTGVSVINPSAVSDKTKHVDGTRTVAFDTSGPDNSGGSYSDSPGFTCSNTYCHSSGQDRNSDGDNSYTSGPSIAWTSSGSCTSCHDDGGSGTTLSGPHLGHTDSGSATATAYGCVMCHAVTVSSAATNDIAPAAVDSHANHVNVTADIDFHASVSGGAGLGYTAGNDGEGTCSEVGCHSSGQATPTYRTPAWNNNPSNVCMYCHGSEGGGVAGEPRYENGGAGFQINDSNSHPAHVGSASDCANCHNDTTTTANTITTPANHLDGNRQVAIATAYEDTPGSFTYDTDNKTCGGLNGLTCHASKQWGGAKLVCLDCHDGAGADTDSWVYNDGTKSAINLNEWTESGHGRTTGNYPGTNSPPANFAGPNPCLYCHTGTVGHNNGNNIFRLRNVGAASSPTDFAGVCLACHGDSSSGVDPDVDDGVAGDQYTPINGTEKVNSYHFGDKHSGNEGGQFCWDCHDPHGDRDSGSGNIAMLHDQVTQVSNGVNGIPVTQVTVTFTQITGLEDYVERGEPIASPPSTKLCNTCHTDSSLHFTQTKGDGHKLGDPDSKGSCAAADCHEHDRPEANTAFGKPLGGPLDCLSAGCHDQAINGSGGPYGDGTYTRRAVTASGDFANTTGGGDTRSHHVGNAGTNMGGAVTNLDCIVCHAEGSYTGSPIPTGTAYHLNRTIDLYDADDTNNVFSYDVDRIRYGPSGAGTDPSAWNSSNPVWREETSGRLDADAVTWPPTITNGWPPTLQSGKGLDRFCISCHDADGAAATYSRETHPAWSQGIENYNPFADGAITNEYDQKLRYEPPVQAGVEPQPTQGPMKVIDVKSQVLAPPLFTVPTPSPTPVPDPDGDGLADPPSGLYARHAIRGMAPSPYKLYQSLPSGSSIWEHLDDENESALMQTDLTGPNQGGPNSFGNDEWGRPIWNDTSVMGCADCHTSDGANTTAGNAHGSDSEYLLKDSHGTATQAVEGNPLPDRRGDTATPSYICYKCHNWDKHGPGVGHTGSQADYKESVGNVGPSNRVTGSAQIFGIACLNCHGAPNWGTIHGTSQQFRRPSGGSNPFFDDTVRKAYRFMNGGSQRYYIENNTQSGSYDPDDWSGTSVTCWTISGADDWSSCTQHGNGYDWNAPLDRPLRY